MRADFAICAFFAYFLCEALAGIAHSKSNNNNSSTASESDFGTTNSSNTEKQEDSNESNAAVGGGSGEEASKNKLSALLDTKKYLKQMPSALPGCAGGIKKSRSSRSSVASESHIGTNSGSLETKVAQSVNTNFADLVDSKRKSPYMQTSYQRKSCSKNKHNDGSVRHRKIKPVKLLMNNPSADVEAEVIKRPSSRSRPVLNTRRLEKGESSMSNYYDDSRRLLSAKNLSISTTSSSSSLAIIPFEQQKEHPNNNYNNNKQREKATAEEKGKKVATLLDTKKRSKSFHSRFPPTAGTNFIRNNLVLHRRVNSCQSSTAADEQKKTIEQKNNRTSDGEGPSQRESTRRPSLGDLLNARRKSEADLESMDTLWEPMNEGIFRF
ncbi:hypothetical protein niasHS_013803 [Heterodera schachtii]|uniref:Uncharacterized protein n=1 Tax=Heterodera schachtii TaxID=97005 RepID=A0ABD2ILU3_HETSC